VPIIAGVGHAAMESRGISAAAAAAALAIRTVPLGRG
jgi:hypothetical protein